VQRRLSWKAPLGQREISGFRSKRGKTPVLTPDEARRLLDSRSVRRQSFWDKERLKLRESLAPLVCNIMRLADGVTSGDWRLSVV
jgi:hypothetical protein